MRIPKPGPAENVRSTTQLRAKGEECKSGLASFLQQNRFGAAGLTPALRSALAREGQRLRARLADNYYGLSVGGAHIHGTSTSRPPFEYTIYTGKLDAATVTDVTDESRYQLRKDFDPCANPLFDLVTRPLVRWVPALTVFSDQVIDAPDPARLKTAALDLLKESGVSYIEMRREYFRLTAGEPEVIAAEYMAHKAQALIGELDAVALSCDPAFMSCLADLAARYGRTCAIFPPEITAIFERPQN